MNSPRVLQVGEEPPPLIGPDQESKERPAKTNPKRKTGERFRGLNTFVDFTMGTLDRAEITVWLVLWRDTKNEGIARTSQTDLARRSGISDRTVRRVLRRLESRGLVVVVRRGGLRCGPSAYRVCPVFSP